METGTTLQPAGTTANTNTIKRTVESPQKAAPDSIVNTSSTKNFVKSRKRTSFKEFVIKKRLRPEVIAGFKVWLKGQFHFFDNEWEEKFHEYTHRKI